MKLNKKPGEINALIFACLPQRRKKRGFSFFVNNLSCHMAAFIAGRPLLPSPSPPAFISTTHFVI
jgi:hypothetical protein